MDSVRFSVSAPGKIILYGEHSVVYGKTAVALSLNLRTVLTLSADASSSAVTLSLPSIKESKTWQREDLVKLDAVCQGHVSKPVALSSEDHSKILHYLMADKEHPSIADRVAVALIFMYRNVINEVSSGIHVEIRSDLPFSAGLGSSASVAVCLSASFLKLAGALSSGKDATGMAGTSLASSDLQMINEWAFMIEKIFHGNPSGVDNTTCTYGGAIVYREGHFHPIKVGCDLNLLVINSMVPRNTKEMVSAVQARLAKYPKIINPVMESMDQIAVMAVDLLQKSDPDKENYEIFEDLISINQGLLTALNVNHPKLQEISCIAERHGFYTKLTGAGGGGVAFTLLKPGLNADNLKHLKMELERQEFQYWEVAVGRAGVEFSV